VQESAAWYWEAGTRQGIDDICQLLQLTDALQAPRLALPPVILASRTPSATSFPARLPSWQKTPAMAYQQAAALHCVPRPGASPALARSSRPCLPIWPSPAAVTTERMT
jgi:hypothetical protein